MQLRRQLTFHCFCLFTFLTLGLLGASASQAQTPNALDFSQISADYKLFYAPNSLRPLGYAFGTGLVVAHTPMDQNFNDWHEREALSKQSNRLSKVAKKFGEWRLLIPVAVGLSYTVDADSQAGQWANQSLRALWVGGPAVLASQVITGGSRPKELRPHHAKWRMFKDNNGVSGHAFVGAIPFLTLAQLNADNPGVYYSATALSLLPAWSRINDRSHYLSQAALGWYIAYHSTQMINASKTAKPTAMQWMPYTDGQSVGIVLNKSFY